MASNIDQFRRQIARIQRDIPRQAEDSVRRAALAIDQALVNETPVDTGRARSNWRVGLDVAPREEVEPRSPQATLDEAKGTLEDFRLGQHRSVRIRSNLSYIDRLNDGHSAQAPAGFIEKATQAGIRALKRGSS